MKLSRILFTSALVWGTGIATAPAVIDAYAVKPVGYTLTGADEFFSGSHLIDGSGLTDPLETWTKMPDDPNAVKHTWGVGVASDNWVTGAPGGFPSDWFEASGTIPTFVFDLGEDRPLIGAHFWQYGSGTGTPGAVQGNGAKSIELRFNTAADGNVDFLGPVYTIDLDHAPPDGEPTGQVLPRQDLWLPDVIDARYVEMRITDSWFVAPGDGTGMDEHGHPIRGGDRVGLGEVRFSMVPEPGTYALALLGLGLLGLARRRRR